MTRARWIGDLSTSFLLEDGWAFRLKINRFQLKGKPGWQMPLSIAEALALDLGDVITLPCANESVDHVLRLERRADACVGSEIDRPLLRLGCHENALAFFVFRHDSYRVIPRHRQEVGDDDPLGLLLWHCGLDPQDIETRADPWPRLARVLGGTGKTPDAVLERLSRRGDKRLVTLLESAVDHHRGAGSPSTWPPKWQYVMPDQDDQTRFMIQRADGVARVALGVLDGTAEPPRDLILGDAGVIWVTVPPATDLDEARQILDSCPAGLVPSARRSSWVRWMRADHAGRRASLLGVGWRVDFDGLDWSYAGERVDDLADALLRLRPGTTTIAADPNARARLAYPRNGLAFATAVKAATERGLQALETAGVDGYRAIYADGRHPVSPSLIDVLHR